MVERSQVVVHEGDEPDSIVHLLDPDVLTGAGLTEVDLALAQADPPTLGDGAVVPRLLE